MNVNVTVIVNVIVNVTVTVNATKLIVQVTEADRRFGIYCKTADSLVQEIGEIEKMACNFVMQYNGQLSYAQAVLLNGSASAATNEKLLNFLNSNYYEV